MKGVRIRRSALPDHPWIYRKQVLDAEPSTRNGDPVRILSREGRPLGAGLYHGRSRIALRVLSREPVEIDGAFLERRIEEAVALRRRVLGLDRRTDAYRVVNAEGDGLSGLIVDRYAGHLVFRIRCLAMFRLAPEVLSILTRHYPGAAALYRRDEEAERIEGFRVPEPPPKAAADIRCDGLVFRVDLARGHKTGAFLDQRDNRRRAAALARGRRVLDLFCYDGGFALACAKAGAREVRGVDLDEAAVARARENARRNRLEVRFDHGDAFDVLRARPEADLILLDPPKWISGRDDEERGMERYRDLTGLALDALPRGGILVSSCCSGRVSPGRFLGVLREAAARRGRDLRILEVRGAAPDHPLAANFPEGRYLTCILAVAG